MAAKFGELVLELGYVTPDQIAAAIERQQQGKYPLGQILVHFAAMNQYQVEETLTYQLSRNGEKVTFGDAAIRLGFITPVQRDDALHYQHTSKGVLGDLLVTLGFITEAQRNSVLQMQLTY